MHQHIVTGRIANLVFFSLVEFGTRASFKIEGAAQRPVVCAVDGDLARVPNSTREKKTKLAMRPVTIC